VKSGRDSSEVERERRARRKHGGKTTPIVTQRGHRRSQVLNFVVLSKRRDSVKCTYPLSSLKMSVLPLKLHVHPSLRHILRRCAEVSVHVFLLEVIWAPSCFLILLIHTDDNISFRRTPWFSIHCSINCMSTI
jgi:hypothetical protein